MCLGVELTTGVEINLDCVNITALGPPRTEWVDTVSVCIGDHGGTRLGIPSGALPLPLQHRFLFCFLNFLDTMN